MASRADEPSSAVRPPCAPCRGTGHVISNLGGESSQVKCPWCEGTGITIPGHNAQARSVQKAATA